jgi:hypothetical protein
MLHRAIVLPTGNYTYIGDGVSMNYAKTIPRRERPPPAAENLHSSNF